MSRGLQLLLLVLLACSCLQCDARTRLRSRRNMLPQASTALAQAVSSAGDSISSAVSSVSGAARDAVCSATDNAFLKQFATETVEAVYPNFKDGNVAKKSDPQVSGSVVDASVTVKAPDKLSQEQLMKQYSCYAGARSKLLQLDTVKTKFATYATSSDKTSGVIEAVAYKPRSLESGGIGCPGMVNAAMWSLAAKCVTLSKLAYSINDQGAGDVQPGNKLADGITVESVAVMGNVASFLVGFAAPFFIASDDTNIYVVFRGSHSVLDWLYNSQFNFASFEIGGKKLGYVHSGFLALWRPSKVLPVIQSLQAKKTRKVVFTGHSLGGALAAIAATEYGMRYGSLPQVFSFGSPRPGDKDFRQSALSTIYHYRFRNGDDIVPQLPVTGQTPILGGLLQNPVPRFYYHAADVSINLIGSTKYRCFTDALLDAVNIDDHSMTNFYFPRVRAISDALSGVITASTDTGSSADPTATATARTAVATDTARPSARPVLVASTTGTKPTEKPKAGGRAATTPTTGTATV